MWLDALRSSEYVQGQNQLTELTGLEDEPARHCCLGVLCELAVAAGVVSSVRDVQDYRTYDGEINYLPSSVQEWAGISHNPMVRGLDDEFGFSRLIPLAAFNDGADGLRRRSFVEIAELVEEQL
jgi:hypothetical protein